MVRIGAASPSAMWCGVESCLFVLNVDGSTVLGWWKYVITVAALWQWVQTLITLPQVCDLFIHGMGMALYSNTIVIVHVQSSVQ